MIALAVLEAVIDASGVAPRVEVMLPVGVRPRQLTARTLLAVRGADLAGQAIKAGLADEVRLFLVPVVVGGG